MALVYERGLQHQVLVEVEKIPHDKRGHAIEPLFENALYNIINIIKYTIDRNGATW